MFLYCLFVLLSFILICRSDEYKWYYVQVGDVASSSSRGTSWSYTSDTNGNLQYTAAGYVGGCGSSAGAYLITFINDDIDGDTNTKWEKIRYTQQFWGETGCWSMLGSANGYGYGSIELGMIEFDINTDELILDNLNYGSWNGEA
eukprot:316228_1